MLRCTLVGILLTIISVGIHATGTTWWIRRLNANAETKLQSLTHFGSLRVLCMTAAFLLILNILEVVVWALAYLAIPDSQLDTLEETVYFSIVTFTSLGYGDVVIASSWRLLSGIEAIAGLLIFGWSTALLFAVVEKIWESNFSK